MNTPPRDQTSPLRHPTRFLLLFLPIALLIIVSMFFIYRAEVDRLHTKHALDARQAVAVGGESISRTLQWISRDLRYLAQDVGVQQMLDNPGKKPLDDLIADWVSFSHNKQVYDKIRWIDENGMERLRINYAKPKPIVVPSRELQDKHERYFFSDTFKLDAGEIFVSPFDLNVENNQLEVPYKPTIRLGMPIFDSKGKKRGILLINYFATDLLSSFGQASRVGKNSAWLVNEDGYWLKGPAPDDEFGFMFGRKELTMAQRYPEAWKKILTEDEGQFETADGLWTFDTVFPLIEGQKTSTGSTEIRAPSSGALESSKYAWKSVYLMPTGEYNAGLLAFNLKLVASALLLLGLFFAAIWRLVLAQLVEQNIRENLEQMVSDRTRDLTESETRLRTLFDTIPDLIRVKGVDGTYLAVNPAFERLIGVSRDKLIGKTAEQFVGEEAAKTFHYDDLAALESGKPLVTEEWLTYAGDGHKALFEVIKVPMRAANGELIGVLGVGRDITERKQAEEKLQQAAMVYQHSSQSIMVTDANGLIVAVNPGFERITGYTAEEVIGKNPSILSSGRQDRAFYQSMWHALNTAGHWQGELWNKRKNGQLYPAWITINAIFNEDGTIDRYVELCSDFTKKKEAEQQLWQQTNFDPLTGMPNRHMFMDHLEQEIGTARHSGVPLALVSLDIDHFKDVNDTLGHDMGDLMLQEIAQRLRSSVRESDIVSHLGGDDFTVILNGMESMSVIEHITQDILKRIAEPFHLKSETVYVTASMGVSIYPDDATTIDDLLKNAEQAMYAAKKDGRNRCNYFTSSMQAAAQVRLRLINDLRGALSANQFQVVYHPIVDLSNGEIHKAESLIRWMHPVRGLISPAEFIAIAEEIEIIADLGNWIFHEAARQVMRWRQSYNPEFQISVNMSPLQFRNDGISHISWFDFMRRLGVPGQGIVIEITEGLLMDVSSGVSAQLLAFRDAGMQVAIDDFGTGYSSLSYIKKFDIDYLKIDQSFVRNLAPESSDLALCEAIIVMAHKLGIKVIAEGVETENQRNLLTTAGCDYGQGMLFSKPLSAPDFEAMLKENISQHQPDTEPPVATPPAQS
ncbi:MAG: EAL domain-containing protein [Burkholderiaceae bacterium]|nr:EAL domain-containing protein [Burkholderiaceae bacterium]